MAAVTICSDFGHPLPQNKVSHCFHCFPIYFPWSDGNQIPWSSFFQCWVLSQLFHSSFSPSSRGSLVPLHFSAIRVLLSAYLRLLIFLPAILLPACDSSNPAFHMMYPPYKLNKQGDNIQPCSTPFLILNQSIVPCLVLTLASWPTHRFLMRQVKVVWYSHLFKHFP